MKPMTRLLGLAVLACCSVASAQEAAGVTEPSTPAAASGTPAAASGTPAAASGTPAAASGTPAAASSEAQLEPGASAGAHTPADGPSTTASAEPTDFRDRLVTAGLRVGVYVPTIVNRMDPFVQVTAELAVLLPVLDRMLGIYGDVSYAGPGASGAGTDPRLGMAGASYAWSMQTHELFFSLGLVFRFLPPGSTFVPYVSAAGRVYLLQTETSGTGAEQPFGKNVEQSTQVGFAVALGGELRLGPGALLLEAGFGYSDLPHRITGPTSTGALAVQLGYRFFF